jgi:hypothetical protein
MLKDIIDSQIAKAKTKLATPWDHYNDQEGTVNYLKQNDLDELLTETAQIVAREVLQDVVNTLDNCRWDVDPRHMSPEQMAHNTTVYECMDKVLKTKITI